MQYYGLIKNDVTAGEGVCVSFFVQGCPIRCPGCHNPEAQSFTGGKEFTQNTLNEILDALTANGVQRNFCVMGGEPLCTENLFLTSLVVSTVRAQYPNIKIYIWTGYTYEELQKRNESKINYVLDMTDILIDGPFIFSERDITLPMRGSRNQRIINLREKNI